MFLKISKCVVLILILHDCQTIKGDRLLVNTIYGRILGHTLDSDKGNQYYAFQEIPFAAPPVGTLRFKEPVPPEKWTNILKTDQNTKICHQIDRSYNVPMAIETEDCLYLNVYTPKNPEENTTDLLPVLVWIYGGGFKNGDATFQLYGPKYFMDYDVVVVTLNYRLGPFGFLTTEDGVIPANLGFKDQNFALQWVQSNIELFGGDPSKVTIMGESAGAVAVGYHLLSKRSEGLFRGAILESATAIASFAHQRWARYYAFQLAYNLNAFTSNNSTELLEFLQNLPADVLKNVQIEVFSEKENGIGSHGKIIWGPVIEDETLDNAFIVGPMHENIKNGNFNKVPTLLGFNSEEELLFIDYDISYRSRQFDNNLEILIHNKFNMTEAEKRKAGSEFRRIYTNGTFEDKLGSVVEYLSDEAFTSPATRQAELQSSYTDVFLYQFSHKGPLPGISTDLIEGLETVTHSEELYYLWDIPSSKNISIFPISDILTRHRLLTLWTNFAKYLNPTPESVELFDHIIWPKVTPDNITFLNINTTLEVGTDPKQYKAFKEIIDKYVTGPLYNY